MARFDYRRQYTNWTKEQIEAELPKLLDRILQFEGMKACADFIKRHSYLKNKLSK